jgi:hypothetical protein
LAQFVTAGLARSGQQKAVACGILQELPKA